ncbi:basement membrane-specific heparan sulfate proteoglycan core protein [Centroberyx affinis]|uniref:basement membrane-specific heparan sulfate proteoglycan core protein n=1 Tax=Centroberyx affinis TaxID=166261 RepID=UPI003A5BB5C0
MWLIKIFSVISLTALCAAEDPEMDASTLLPMSSVTPTLSLDPPAGLIYQGERATLNCTASGSSPSWTYLWFHNDQETPLQISDPSYTIMPAVLTDSSKYWCKVKRGEELSAFSNAISFAVIDPPKPSLKLKTRWLDVFQTEKVELSCEVTGSSDWTFTWYRDAQDLPEDSTLSLGAGGSSLTISSVGPTHRGLYTCKGHHKTRKISSALSNTTDIRVYDNKPKPTLSKDPGFEQLYVGEAASISCRVGVSSGWEYLWYKDGKQLSTSDNSKESYIISSPALSDGGKYTCKATRGTAAFLTEDSDKLTLDFIDPPKPSLKLKTRWLDVFQTEKVELSCEVTGSSDWTFTWYRDAQDLPKDSTLSLGAGGSSLTISSVGPTHRGLYTCKGHHKTRKISSALSNTTDIKVYDNKPKPTLSKDPGFEQLYVGEAASISCRVGVSSGWEYLWYKDGKQLSTSDNSKESYIISSPALPDGGKYTCKATRGTAAFLTEDSDELTLDFIDPPKPSLKLKTRWLDVFQTEKVELSCEVTGSSDWTFTWYRDAQDLPKDSTLSLGAGGSSLTISSVGPTHRGLYTCKGHHKTRKISSALSNTTDIKVYDNKPKPTLSKDPGFEQIYVGEAVSISCRVDVSSGWEYLWYKDGKQLSTSDNSKESYNISSPALSDGGKYTCKATRGTAAFLTEDSDKLTLDIIDIPFPSLELQTPWPDVFPSERVEMSCGVQGSSEWAYTWYRNDQKLSVDQNVSLGVEGSSLTLFFAKKEYAGGYTCSGQHKNRPVKTELSNAILLTVYPNKPKPLMTQDPSDEKVYTGESVSFGCTVNVSSDWKYLWYKNKALLPTSGDSFNIPAANSLDNGTYQCMAWRGNTVFNTEYSEERILCISEIPVPLLKLMTPWLDVFPTESVELSCGIQSNSDWSYHWYRGSELLVDHSISLTSDGATLSIHSASNSHQGQYKCRGRHKSRSLSTKTSSELTLQVYVRPWAVMTLLTGWSEVFSTDSLVLRCEVQGSQDLWNYTWYREEQQQKIDLAHSEKHTVTPQDNPNQSQYICQGTRTGRPSFSTKSEPFKTKNLLLKRRVLLAISGCLFFGIIAVFLGCIALRLTRKPAENGDKSEEANLFLTMAELKARDDAPCPLAEYVTEAALTASNKDGDDNGTICSESTPLPITSQEDQAVTPESLETADSNGGLLSFK